MVDVLERIKPNRTKLAIEVKNPKRYPGIGEQIRDMVLDMGMKERVVISSFDIDFIVDLYELDSSLTLGGIYSWPPKFSAPELAYMHCVSVNQLSGILFPKRIQKIQSRGIVVWAWTVNSRKKAESLTAKGFDGIITDFPNIMN